MATPRPVMGHAHHSSVLDLAIGPRRIRRAGLLRSGLVLGAAALTLTVLPGTAVATPGDAAAATPEQLTQMVADASHQLEVVTEQVNSAQEVLSQQQAAVAAADQAAADAQARLGALDGQIRQIARSAYTGSDNHFATLQLLMTSDSAEDFVSQLGTLDAIAGHTNDVVAQVSTAADAAKKAQADADQAETTAQQTLTDVTSKQAQLQSQIADYKKQYAALTAPQQQQVNAAHSGQALAAPAAPVAAPSGAAGVAVQTALAQVGDPYVWGAAGPNAFDCSGLMQYSYAAAGISLPHSSSMQSTMGTPVSRDQLQPGDLVFFYSPVSHVGMYIGNGQMVHASTSGTPVQVVSLDSMPDYNSARRLT